MELIVGKEIAALKRMTVGELRERYAEVFGEETLARNKQWLVIRIIWRNQSLTEGSLSERARTDSSATMAAMSDAQPSKLNLWMDFLVTNKVDENSAPLLATRCARQPLYWWCLGTLTEGAKHETSAGSAAGDGDGRVWGWQFRNMGI